MNDATVDAAFDQILEETEGLSFSPMEGIFFILLLCSQTNRVKCRNHLVEFTF